MKGSTTVPIKGVDDKRQITATFRVSASGSFVPIQFMYSCKNKRCLPKYDFPNRFDVTFTPNHWSSFDMCVSLFEKIIILYLKEKKEELGYPKEQYSLIVMDAFKGQDNAEIKELCSKNECEVVIVPHNLTIKLQPLNITINQKAKKFISYKFNTRYGDRFSNQFKGGEAPGNVRLSLENVSFETLACTLDS